MQDVTGRPMLCPHTDFIRPSPNNPKSRGLYNHRSFLRKCISATLDAKRYRTARAVPPVREHVSLRLCRFSLTGLFFDILDARRDRAVRPQCAPGPRARFLASTRFSSD